MLDENWANSIGVRFLDLAEDNFAQFAPDSTSTQPWVANVGKQWNNQSRFRMYHALAINEAQKMLQSAGMGPRYLSLSGR